MPRSPRRFARLAAAAPALCAAIAAAQQDRRQLSFEDQPYDAEHWDLSTWLGEERGVLTESRWWQSEVGGRPRDDQGYYGDHYDPTHGYGQYRPQRAAPGGRGHDLGTWLDSNPPSDQPGAAESRREFVAQPPDRAPRRRLVREIAGSEFERWVGDWGLVDAPTDRTRPPSPDRSQSHAPPTVQPPAQAAERTTVRGDVSAIERRHIANDRFELYRVAFSDGRSRLIALPPQVSPSRLERLGRVTLEGWRESVGGISVLVVEDIRHPSTGEAR